MLSGEVVKDLTNSGQAPLDTMGDLKFGQLAIYINGWLEAGLAAGSLNK